MGDTDKLIDLDLLAYYDEKIKKLIKETKDEIPKSMTAEELRDILSQ